MKLQMKIKLFDNLGLKILSLLIAMILWLGIVNMADPIITRTFYNISVEILNENAITDVNRVYEVVSGKKIDVKVKGKRSVVDNIEESDLRATADLSELSRVNAVAINVVLKSGNSGRSNVELDWGNAVLQVSLEKKVTDKFKVDVKTEGRLDSNYVLGEVSVQPNIIEVSGGKSKVSKIASIGVVVQLDGKIEDFKADLTPTLYDSDGNVITDTGNLILNYDTVRVSTTIMPTKTIPVSFDVTGSPKVGYRLVQTDFQPETITVSGKKEDLDRLERLTIPLAIHGESDDVEKEIDVTRYLPAQIKPAENSKTISVRCVIEKEGRRTYTLSNSDIKVVNLPNNLNFSFEEAASKYTVVVTGSEDDLKNMDISSLGAYIDVEDLAAGNHVVMLQYELPDGVKTKSKCKIKIRLFDTAETTPEEKDTIIAPSTDE